MKYSCHRKLLCELSKLTFLALHPWKNPSNTENKKDLTTRLTLQSLNPASLQPDVVYSLIFETMSSAK